jgi:polysaccharide biosynthesis/export protein
MKGFGGRPSVRLTICLSLLVLLTPLPSGAQSSTDQQASQAVPAPAANTDTTTANTPGDSDSSATATAGPDYILGPEDEIDIEVLNVPELKQTVRVAADGKISVPLIGRVPASGLTPEQLRQELAEQWGENYLQDPQVSVFVKEFKARPVSVLGAVEKPNLYYLKGQRNLIEVLSMAGGFGKASSSGRTVIVTRKGGFGDLQLAEGMHVRGPDQIEIDLNRLIYTRDPGLNIEIKPFDIVSVSKADVVYVTGAVKKPGGFVLDDRPTITVIQAIAMAEGFSGTASRGGARILRTQKDGSKVQIPVNLTRVMKGKAEDLTLAANDVLYVPDSKTKVAGQRAVDASVSTFSAWLIWGVH